MSNLLSLVRVKNNPKREGFDLSTKRNFTAKAGELLPVWWSFVLPGDSIQGKLQSFTRTKPLNSAANARIKEYFNFYYVPLEQLWNKAPEVISQMLENKNHAQGKTIKERINFSGDLPYVTTTSLVDMVSTAQSKKKFNLFHRYESLDFAKLFQYLGYGNYYGLCKDDSSANGGYTNLQQTLFPFLAYQKIYNDYYRFQQWEISQPWTFNVDYMKGTDDLNFFSGLNISDYISEQSTPFTLRYANYQRDVFRGILPRAQYGSEAQVSLPLSGGPFRVSSASGAGLKANQPLLTTIDSDGFIMNPVQVQSKNGAMSPVGINSGQFTSSLSILALRQAQALQKWKEISIANNEDIASQIQAHWGVSIPEVLSDKCKWLGGNSSNLDVNEVVNSNITDQNAANLAGKGVISNNGTFNWTSKGEYGIIMCIYHCEPIIDYVTTGVGFQNTIVSSSSFPVPEFDQIGMDSLQKEYLMNTITQADPDYPSLIEALPNSLGYLPRYYQWKMDVDRSFGDFSESMRSWILPFDDVDVYRQIVNLGNGDLSNPNVNKSSAIQYGFFKVNPEILDDLFVNAVDNTLTSDQFQIYTYFDVKVARNLDTDGLPY